MKSISLISIRLICLLEDIERREHKLRKYLSLKLDYIYLKLYLTKCFNDLQILYKRYVYLNKNLGHYQKFKSTSKVVPV